ncbi:hypothetical protein RJ639_010292, partial [Escallonia herrerae]
SSCAPNLYPTVLKVQTTIVSISSQMGRGMETQTAHCLVLPFPTHGHLNPMTQFSTTLHRKGVEITLATTLYIAKNAQINAPSFINIETISDGFDIGGPQEAESHEAYYTKFQQVGAETLGLLIEKLCRVGRPVDCIVYDAFLPWAVDVAKKFGLLSAVFLTQSSAVNNIYYHVHQGLLNLRPNGSDVMVNGLPPLELSDMPSYICDPESFPSLANMLLNQFFNVDKVDWVLCNSFYELEEEVVDWMQKQLPLKTIGPAIPMMHTHKSIKFGTMHGFNVFKPRIEASMEWLNKRAEGSVVYVSFGGFADLRKEQMVEIAWGLRRSKRYFLWVVRATEEAKIPKNFMEDTLDQGLVVSWCPQLEVLAHKAIGCFVTHTGWNSTLEAICSGIPLVAIPQGNDQNTNAKFVADVWKVGVRAKPDHKGLVTQEVVQNCIMEVMKGGRENNVKERMAKWRELAIEALGDGGSSDKNTNEFVENLVRSKSY